ncbi:isoprenoid biosynthesis glyoxalase ElbB [Martelella alba]|uniref:Isoprenoid biosynthesis glyoxalase ElbB n=1 Tax=Martelella alba TaxID=2590451 RepID=A0ABY2SS30_9HYPH|nr:isoprenoid biosynthesis glyoxalase ElbB [Martelella alba]TKI06925.1 isoprenoid biosynthesis glyoxalase ElbB [Martelella alba]
MQRVGLVLCGCGVNDGSDIHETVLTQLALERAGAEVICFAPDRPQSMVIDHITGNAVTASRGMLAESARLAHGPVHPLAAARADELDALIVPGGAGAVRNFSDIAEQGVEGDVDDDLRQLARQIHKQGKPLGFICIAPALLPKILDVPLRLTIGNDNDTAELIDAMGAIHVVCPVEDIVIDAEHKVITTPGNMLATSLCDLAKGIDKLVNRVLEMCE